MQGRCLARFSRMKLESRQLAAHCLHMRGKSASERYDAATLQSIHSQMLQGLNSYVNEQLDAFEVCQSAHDATECALHFEALGAEQEAVFFHCDQVRPFPLRWRGG